MPVHCTPTRRLFLQTGSSWSSRGSQANISKSWFCQVRCLPDLKVTGTVCSRPSCWLCLAPLLISPSILLIPPMRWTPLVCDGPQHGRGSTQELPSESLAWCLEHKTLVAGRSLARRSQLVSFLAVSVPPYLFLWLFSWGCSPCSKTRSELQAKALPLRSRRLQ